MLYFHPIFPLSGWWLHRLLRSTQGTKRPSRKECWFYWCRQSILFRQEARFNFKPICDYLPLGFPPLCRSSLTRSPCRKFSFHPSFFKYLELPCCLRLNDNRIVTIVVEGLRRRVLFIFAGIGRLGAQVGFDRVGGRLAIHGQIAPTIFIYFKLIEIFNLLISPYNMFIHTPIKR